MSSPEEKPYIELDTFIFAGLLRIIQYSRKLNGVLLLNKPSGVNGTNMRLQVRDDIYSKLGEDPVVKGKPGNFRLFSDYNMAENFMGVFPMAFGDTIKSFKLHNRQVMNSMSCVVTGNLGEVDKSLFYNEERKSYEHVTRESLENRLEQFIGEVTQKVIKPISTKFDDKTLIDIVKEGLPIPEEAFYIKTSQVHKIVCTEFNPPIFKFEIDCDSSLRLQNMVYDLGNILGTCAELKQLLYTKRGPFTLEDAVDPCSYTTDELLELLQKYKHLYRKEIQKQNIDNPRIVSEE